MTSVKILKETLRMVDGGRVVCTAETTEGARVESTIEASFFEDFMGTPNPKLSFEHKARIVMDNLAYFEKEVARQMGNGHQTDVVIL